MCVCVCVCVCVCARARYDKPSGKDIDVLPWTWLYTVLHLLWWGSIICRWKYAGYAVMNTHQVAQFQY